MGLSCQKCTLELTDQQSEALFKAMEDVASAFCVVVVSEYGCTNGNSGMCPTCVVSSQLSAATAAIAAAADVMSDQSGRSREEALNFILQHMKDIVMEEFKDGEFRLVRQTPPKDGEEE